MAYTFCIRIVEKAYGKTCQIHDSISQIQCYVSVITRKHDLSFQLTYHTLIFDFQATSAEGHALLDMSRIQTVVLDLRTSSILILVLSTRFLLSAFFSFLFFSDRVRPQFVLVKLPLSCDHNWIRSGPVNNVR